MGYQPLGRRYRLKCTRATSRFLRHSSINGFLSNIRCSKPIASSFLWCSSAVVASGTYLVYHSPVFTPWQPAGHRHNVETIPEYQYGAASGAVGQAFQMIRQHPQLAMVVDAKILRTVLQAQERTAERIISAEDDEQRYDLMIASLKRAGLGAVINASVARPKATHPTVEPGSNHKKGPDIARSPPPAEGSLRPGLAIAQRRQRPAAAV